MPFESDRQRRAMYAAASGKSTIGIPQSVGQRFVSDDSKASGAASQGVRHSTSTKSRLYDVMKKRREEKR